MSMTNRNPKYDVDEVADTIEYLLETFLTRQAYVPNASIIDWVKNLSNSDREAVDYVVSQACNVRPVSEFLSPDHAEEILYKAVQVIRSGNYVDEDWLNAHDIEA